MAIAMTHIAGMGRRSNIEGVGGFRVYVMTIDTSAKHAIETVLEHDRYETCSRLEAALNYLFGDGGVTARVLGREVLESGDHDDIAEMARAIHKRVTGKEH